MAGRNSAGAASQPPAVQQEKKLYPTAQTGEISAKFMKDVIREYGTTIGAPELNGYQKRLIQSYFIGIDRALVEADSRRDNTNPPIDWQHVNTPSLFIDVVNCVKLGLDMAQPNHVYAIPYFNKRLGLYDVTLMKGYAGIAYIAMKYAADPPRNVTLQLVYSTDTFRPHMKGAGNAVESYEFEITNPFERGKIIGGFGYIEYEDPQKNRLVMMSRADMDRRKPKRASRNFWGKWDDEMYLKTLARHVYSTRYIPLDPMKTDDAYQQMKLREVQYAALEAETQTTAYANRGAVLEIPTAPVSLPEAASVPVYMPGGEIDAMKLPAHHRLHPLKKRSVGLSAFPQSLSYGLFEIGTFAVRPFQIFHDTPEPVGYLMASANTNETLLYFTDTYYLQGRFRNLTYIIGECNYDSETMWEKVRSGETPAARAKRLFSTHMSLKTFLEFLESIEHPETMRQIYICHMSDDHGNEDAIREAVQRLTGAEVYVC